MTYPKPLTQTHPFRCPATHGDRRCQLLAGHKPVHASIAPGDARVLRWDDQRSWLDEPTIFGLTAERLPWESMRYD